MTKVFMITIVMFFTISCSKTSEKNISYCKLNIKKHDQMICVFDDSRHKNIVLSKVSCSDTISVFDFIQISNRRIVYNKTLFDEKLKGEIVEKSKDTSRMSSLKDGSSYLYWYDEQGFLISYCSTFCINCSISPYNYVFKYNSEKLLSEIKNVVNYKSSIVFSYNSKSEVEKIEFYCSDRLIESWEFS